MVSGSGRIVTVYELERPFVCYSRLFFGQNWVKGELLVGIM